ncbi:conjugal transfer protein MobB [Elizabethkingia anophelis]|uniref:conjugal transfer protein MobB n=1 Tax=Elizabethkingia anophelis TaxID=1117645 RepID=UPI00136DCABC|nr:conjugal transfer protein MobB [Elizabethkingia anophelis]MYY43941.1 relaxase [Elizabethkingia anophelis]
MIAKISHGANLYGVISYNQRKVDQEKATLLCCHKLPTPYNSSQYTPLMLRFFEPYLAVNIKTEKPVLHISLNPDPKDKISDDGFREMAQRYMEDMGYGNQPFLVYKHKDIERTHIHIVSLCIDENGRKIDDSFEKRRSMSTCRKLEQEFKLTPITDKKRPEGETFSFTPVDYKKNDLKSQMASVIRYLPKYYSFSTLGEYNALLSLFNITCEKLEGQYRNTTKTGLLYFALNEKGEKVASPLKASLFGKIAGLPQLNQRMENARNKYSDKDAVLMRNRIIETLQNAIQLAKGEVDFKSLLQGQGMSMVVRRTESGRIYGITFIDQHSRSVWNGSRLDKQLSARIFDNWWNAGKRPIFNENHPNTGNTGLGQKGESTPGNFNIPSDISMRAEYGDGLLGFIGSLVPAAQGEDFEELNFEYQMKRKRKRRKKM